MPRLAAEEAKSIAQRDRALTEAPGGDGLTPLCEGDFLIVSQAGTESPPYDSLDPFALSLLRAFAASRFRVLSDNRWRT